MTAPCLECPDRHLGCHSECEKYQKFAKFRARENARVRRVKADCYGFKVTGKKRKPRNKNGYII